MWFCLVHVWRARGPRLLLFSLYLAASIVSTSRTVAQTPLCCTGPLVLIDADGSKNPTNILVTFSEAVSAATATNVVNYTITNTLTGAALTIQSTTLANNTVLLKTSPRAPLQNYILVVNRIQDAACANRTIIPNSSIPVAAEMMTLVGMNSPYRYYNPIPFFGDNPDLGSIWTAPSYNDANTGTSVYWATNSSIFYSGSFDTNVPGPVAARLDQSDALISYFRSRFNVPFSPAGALLFLSHIVDDGAVFHLNGSEIHRFNLPDGPPPYREPIPYDTPALTSLINITRANPILLPSAPLVFGSNLLAVQLHQFESLDIDAAYGAELEARVMSYVTGPVVMTGGVADQTVLENQPVTFSAMSVAGARFQWQQNSNNIPGRTNATYTIQQTPLTLNGSRFRIIVSNATSGIISTNATLRVIADTNPPAVLSAILTTPSNALQILYSEPVTAASATNLAHYTITNSLGEPQPITAATLRNGTIVTLSLGDLSGSGLRLVINGVRDIAAAANPLAGVVIQPGISHLAVAKVDGWKYLLINTNQSVQTNYYKPTYDDTATGPHGAWSGPSLSVLHVESGQLMPGWTKNTQLSMSTPSTNRINTHYFRKIVSSPLQGGTITLRGQVLFDDGVVLYLNGKELARFNMPTGTITAATQALRGHENTESVPTFEITITNWIAGDNLLAAEVHQNGAASADIVFGLELIVTTPGQFISPTYSPAHITLLSCRTRYAIEWTHSGVLESSDTATGPWSPISFFSPYLVSPTNLAAFYRVRR